jgi:hypothetical protein
LLDKKLEPKASPLKNLSKIPNKILNMTKSKMLALQRKQQALKQAADMRNQQMAKTSPIRLIYQVQLIKLTLWSKRQITVNLPRLMSTSLPQMSLNQGKEQWLHSILGRHHPVR